MTNHSLSVNVTGRLDWSLLIQLALIYNASQDAVAPWTLKQDLGRLGYCLFNINTFIKTLLYIDLRDGPHGIYSYIEISILLNAIFGQVW